MSSLAWGKAQDRKLLLFKSKCLKCLSLPGCATKCWTTSLQLEKQIFILLFCPRNWTLLEAMPSEFTDILGGCLSEDELCLVFTVVFSELSWQLKKSLLSNVKCFWKHSVVITKMLSLWWDILVKEKETKLLLHSFISDCNETPHLPQGPFKGQLNILCVVFLWWNIYLVFGPFITKNCCNLWHCLELDGTARKVIKDWINSQSELATSVSLRQLWHKKAHVTVAFQLWCMQMDDSISVSFDFLPADISNEC